MTRAMLLCAGFGTRLGALSDERPKPMLPVCNFPILRYGIALLVGHGIENIVINLHHRGHLIEDELGDGSQFGAHIRYLYESTILGTGGGLKNALDLLDPDGRDEPFLSLNGKLIFDLDLSTLLAAYRDIPDSLGMMAVRKIPESEEGRWGAVDVDMNGDTGLVKNILGPGAYMFGGVHVTRPSVIRRLPDGEACMVRQGYLPWLRAGEPVSAYAVPNDRYFAEHSTPKRYLESNLRLLKHAALRFPPRATATQATNTIPNSFVGIDEHAQVHPLATIRPLVCIGARANIGKNATLGPHVIVGADATILPGATIERAVVWPGARVEGNHHDCIVTSTSVVDAA